MAIVGRDYTFLTSLTETLSTVNESASGDPERMVDFMSPRHDAYAIGIQVQRRLHANDLGRHGVGMATNRRAPELILSRAAKPQSDSDLMWLSVVPAVTMIAMLVMIVGVAVSIMIRVVIVLNTAAVSFPIPP
jgi:hypothetical protein